MASLSQTLTLNTDLFPLGAAINKTFQKTATINGNATIFGSISLDPLNPSNVEVIELSPIDDRAIIFLQADANNGTDRINVGLHNETGLSGVADSISLTTSNPGAYTDLVYTNVATTGGTGTGLTLNVTVSSGAITAVVIADAGYGYTASDVVTVNGLDLGGVTPIVDDATFTIGAVTTAPTFDVLMELAAGDISLVPFKYSPQVSPSGTSKLAVKLVPAPTGTTARMINFSILETA